MHRHRMQSLHQSESCHPDDEEHSLTDTQRGDSEVRFDNSIVRTIIHSKTDVRSEVEISCSIEVKAIDVLTRFQLGGHGVLARAPLK